MDTPGGPAGRSGRWHEYVSKFDPRVTHIPGRHDTVADALSRWAYPASEAYSGGRFHGTSTDKADVMELDKKKQALINEHCLQCRGKNTKKVEAPRCKEISMADQTGNVN